MHTNILTLSHLPANLRAEMAQATLELGAKMADVTDKARVFPPVWSVHGGRLLRMGLKRPAP